MPRVRCVTVQPRRSSRPHAKDFTLQRVLRQERRVKSVLCEAGGGMAGRERDEPCVLPNA